MIEIKYRLTIQIFAFSFRRKTEQQVSQLEAESKKLRTELSNLRQSEADLRAQVHVSSVSERYLKVELTQMKYENESLQQK